MIKITGTNSYIDVETDGKTLRIYGERTVSGFICMRNSIQNWTEPEGVPVTEAEKKILIQKITEKTKDSHMVISFE